MVTHGHAVSIEYQNLEDTIEDVADMANRIANTPMDRPIYFHEREALRNAFATLKLALGRLGVR